MIVCKPKEVNCAICQKPFVTNHSQGKYCSPECSKEGERASWRKYGSRNRPQRQAYHKSHYRNNKSKITERIKRYISTERGKEVHRKAWAKQRLLHPEKVNARTSVMVALRTGKLFKKPCEECGVQKTEAHHTDYSKPLDVIWLCKTCHEAKHHDAGPMEIKP